MPARLLEWLARTLMLVLAGLVTLSILGSIAAISNDVGRSIVLGNAMPEPAPQNQVAAEPAAATKSGAEGPARAETDATSTLENDAGHRSAAGEREPRWQEAIAYALLGLAGLLALGLVLLALALRQLRRIANAIEAGRP